MVKDKKNMTALHNASLSGHTKIVQLLLQMGVDINPKTDHEDPNLRFTAFRIALLHNHKDIVGLFLCHYRKFHQLDSPGFIEIYDYLTGRLKVDPYQTY